MGDIIKVRKDGTLEVPEEVIIPFIEGDGIGKEITLVVQHVLDRAVSLAYPHRKIHWREVLAGEKAIESCGSPLPDETVKILKSHVVSMKGPLGTPVGEGMRSINVALRQTLDLYVCQRPVRWYKGVVSPVRHPESVDMTVFRENTEDIYCGIEWEQGTPEANQLYEFLRDTLHVNKVRFPSTSSFGIKPVSVEGSERLIRSALQYALDHRLPSVTLVHKGNIMKFTEGGFRKWGYVLAEREFGDRVFCWPTYEAIKKEKGKPAAEKALAEAQKEGKLIVKDCIADAFLQNILLKPHDYSVIATLNLNGDYISDALAAMVGGIGIAPGANINYQTGCAVFEATHGTAPDIAGEGKANPTSLLLSAAMLCEYIGWPEVSKKVYNALEKCFAEGKATADLASMMDNGTPLSTEAFGEALLSYL